MLNTLMNFTSSQLFIGLSFVFTAAVVFVYISRYQRMPQHPQRHPLKGLMLLFCCFVVLYTVNLDGYRINDDEGGYLYASWRITQGELPYRDFMTPQMPLFLHSGASLFHYFGPGIYIVRLFSVVMVLAAAFFLYLLACELFDPHSGFFAVLFFLSNYLVYYHTRSYRSDPLMMAFCILALYFLVRGEKYGKWRYYFCAGLFYGVATSFKLFGLFPMMGVGLYWLYQLKTAQISFKELIGKCLVIGTGLVLVPLLTVGGMLLLVPNLYEFLIGHHLKQGSGWSTWQVVAKSLTFIVKYIIHNQILVALAGMGVYSVLNADEDAEKAALLLIFLPSSLLLFFLLPRPSYNRHMMYLIPVFSLLAARGTITMFTWKRNNVRLLAFTLVLVYFLTNHGVNWQRGHKQESATQKLATLIQKYVSSDEYLVADYASLAFHARRKMPPLLGGASQGSIASGQTRVDDYLENIEKYQVKMVIVQNDGHGTIQMVPNFQRLRNYLKENYQLIFPDYKREKETFDIYLLKTKPLQTPE